jgi:hypothetical protein
MYCTMLTWYNGVCPIFRRSDSPMSQSPEYIVVFIYSRNLCRSWMEWLIYLKVTKNRYSSYLATTIQPYHQTSCNIEQQMYCTMLTWYNGVCPIFRRSDSPKALSNSDIWLYGSWIYNYLCNQFLSPPKLWVRILLMVRCTRYNIMW